MSKTNHLASKPRWQGVSEDVLRWMQTIVDGFESEWESGQPPNWRAWYDRNTDPANAHRLLEELLEIDVAFRQRLGLACDLAHYRSFMSDQEVVFKEVWEKLSPFQVPRSFVTQTWQRAAARAPEHDSGAKADAVQLPARIGRYEVERLLGQGGFGMVYLAKDSLLHRPVALKVPHQHLIPAVEDIEQHLHEARTVASLNHPNIVPVYDVGGVPGFPLFIVSQYIAGTDLATLIRLKRLSARESVPIVATVANALHYAHQHGFVHRDVKPANVLIDEHQQPFIVDFGLALREADLGYGPQLAGTPAYMSPEQARGEGHRVDGRSDVFSLGAVLYQLLTGRLPFMGDTIESLLEQISNCDARPPRQLDHSLPKELERICLKALAKKLSERYTNAFDMAEDLQVFLQSRQAADWLSGDSRGATPSKQSASPKPQHVAEPDESRRVLLAGAGVTPTPSTPGGIIPGLHVVPKGLRSFDEYDAEFFIELLAGPRDRNGLPESIRFWKTRLEQLSPDKTFTVGLLYGPSGCGKSSLMKAGVLPRLADNVTAIYIEAAYGITESKLLAAMRRAISQVEVPEHALAHDASASSLTEMIARCRRGSYLPVGHKLVIVIDQFEQWLLDWNSGNEAELISALRQCDGAHVQCVIMVRDDFWLATSRFMQALEVPLVEHHNAELVDLFDPAHARKVLRYIGTAYECLPDREAMFTTEHREFLNKAVDELSQDGKVICVRLAMLAEMLKSKPWNPKTLREMGGIDGVGVAFLEDSFSARHAPREHSLHQEAARRVLRELLPESASDVKGRMRTFSELIKAAGYEHREQDFLRLLAILDGSLRLITPVEFVSASGSDKVGNSSLPSEVSTATHEQAYQLTHDFLVQAVRTWIELKQRETWRGRAELKLVERTSIWHATREARQLPNILEWFQIHWLTRPNTWTAQQAAMMKSARNYHLQRAGTSLAILAIASGLIYLVVAQALKEMRQTNQAVRLVQNIMTAPVDELFEHVQAARSHADYTMPLLANELEKLSTQSTTQSTTLPSPNSSVDRKRQTRASLALLAADPGQLDFLYKQLLEADPEYLPVLRQGLDSFVEQIRERLSRDRLQDNSAARPLNMLAAHSLFDPANPQWASGWAKRVLELLQEVDSNELEPWLRVFKSNQRDLLELIRGDTSAVRSRVCAAVLCNYAKDDPDLLFRKLLTLDFKDLEQVARTLSSSASKYAPELKRQLQQQTAFNPDVALWGYQVDGEEERHRQDLIKARAAATLMLWDDFETVWMESTRPEDPRLASELIQHLPIVGLQPGKLLEQLRQQSDPRVRQLIALALGKYPFGALSRREREEAVDQLATIYRQSPDSGLRSSASWTLQQWNQNEFLRVQEDEQKGKVVSGRNWFVDSSGITMAIVRGPTTSIIGADPFEWGRQTNGESNQVRVQIDHDFAIALHEVTMGQFRQCHQEFKQYFRDDLNVDIGWSNRSMDSPATSLSYFDAALYCRWLGEKEGIPEAEQCYPSADKIKFGMELPENFLERKGYRLPTRAEWEVACRAGTTSPLNFGSSFSPYANYAWTVFNSNDQNHPVGQLMPNQLGLFDIHGNSFEWCANIYLPVLKVDVTDTLIDGIGPREFQKGLQGVLKGGEFPSRLNMHCSAFQHHVALDMSWPASGMRVVKTLHSPPLSCRVARHLGMNVEHEVSGVDNFEIIDVRGPVKVVRRADRTIDVALDPSARATRACQYSFGVRTPGSDESVQVAGELLSCDFRTRVASWHDEQTKTDLQGNFLKTISSMSLLHDEVLLLHQLKSKLDGWNSTLAKPAAIWSEGKLSVAGGRYEFWLRTEDSVHLFIDDQLILNTSPISSLRTDLETTVLSPGEHTLRIEHLDFSPPIEFSLSVLPALSSKTK